MLAVDLHDIEKLSSLAPFLRGNPCLKNITLTAFHIGPACVSIIANILSNRPEAVIEVLGLSHIFFGDTKSCIDQLGVEALA